MAVVVGAKIKSAHVKGRDLDLVAEGDPDSLCLGDDLAYLTGPEPSTTQLFQQLICPIESTVGRGPGDTYNCLARSNLNPNYITIPATDYVSTFAQSPIDIQIGNGRLSCSAQQNPRERAWRELFVLADDAQSCPANLFDIVDQFLRCQSLYIVRTCRQDHDSSGSTILDQDHRAIGSAQ